MGLEKAPFFLKKYWLVILAIASLAGVFSTLIAQKLPPLYEVSSSIFVSREITAPPTNFYSYDGYYSQQSAERFTDSLVGLLRNKEIVRQALLKSGKDGSDVAGFSRRIKVKRLSPQLVAVSFADYREDFAVSFLGNLVTEITTRVRTLNLRGDKLISLSVLENTPFVERKEFKPAIIGLVAFFVLSLLLSLIFSFLENVQETVRQES